MIPGIDRSHLNAPYPLAKLYQQGVRFVIFKATQGLTYVDPTFDASWQEAKSTCGLFGSSILLRGAYHFYDPRFDGIAQAKHYLSLGIDFNSAGCLPPCVDVEDLVGSNKIDTININKWVADNWRLCLQRLIDFISYVEQQTGKKVIIYSYNTYMRETYHGHAFPDNRFWLSSIQAICPHRYDTNELPDFWQYTYNWKSTDMDGSYGIIDQAELDSISNNVSP